MIKLWTKYNGKVLDGTVEGFRTLEITGRDTNSVTLNTSTNDYVDGSTLLGKRIPARTIKVRYLIEGGSHSQVVARQAKLLGLINQSEECELIFSDEEDKYFKAIYSGYTNETVYQKAITATLKFECLDPYKYSTTLKEFTSNTGTVTVTNEGTADATIDYEISCASESGYFGIVSEHGVMQYGKIEEADKESYSQNETLATVENLYACADDTSGTDAMHPYYGANGTLAKKSWFGKTYLGFGSTGTKKGYASGGLRTYTLPADSSGVKGATNWYSYFHVIMYAGLMGQLGEMCINFITSDNKFVAGYNWCKTDASGNTGYCDFCVYKPNGTTAWGDTVTVLRQWEFQTNHIQGQNPWYYDWGHCDILKQGSQIRFFYSGGYYWYTVPEIANMQVAKIQLAVKQYGNDASKFISMIGMDKMIFQKQNVTKWRDVPNRFSAGTTLTIDGETSHVYVNGMYKPQEEVVGSTYFKAPVGDTEIKVHASSWCKSTPKVTARIRERWL